MVMQHLSTHVITNVTLVTTAETIVATLSGINTPGRRTIGLRGWLELTTGVATTAVTLRLRRGPLVTDTLVSEAVAKEVGAAAGSDEEFSIEVDDVGQDMAGGTYVLTAQQTAATGNGTVLQSRITADIPD